MGSTQPIVVSLVVLAGAAAGSVSAMATGDVQAAPAANVATHSPATTRSNPYATLFQPRTTPSPRFDTRTPPGGTTARQGPRMVCGMTIITADPGIDPGISAPAPPTTTRFTIRAVEPPICR
jgi:hypothetical protein